MMGHEPRRRGRPALTEGEKPVYVTVALPSRQYNKVYEQAQRQRRGIPDEIRRKLRYDDDDE